VIALHLSHLAVVLDASTGGSTSKSKGSPIGSFIILGLFVLVAFFFIRSSRARRAQGAKMQADLAPGVEVITVGGLIATVRAIDDEAVHLEIAPGVVARFVRRSIGTVVTPREPVEEGPVVPDAESHDPDLPEPPHPPTDERPELPPDDRPPAGT
jgi:preprotein translocase subunit YajC